MESTRPYSLEQGRELVLGARQVVESVTSSPRFSKRIIEEQLYRFNQRHGVFVAIEFYPTKAIRGLMGFTHAIAPMNQLLVDAALAAATEDPRFVSVTKHELESIIIEVSILSEPVQVRGKTLKDLKKQIKAGRDGLIIQYGYRGGLLLPIVALEEKWDTGTFLDNLCIKAGLAKHTWRVHDVTLYKFTTQVFHELEPRGDIGEQVLK